jgi:hypothetical protein
MKRCEPSPPSYPWGCMSDCTCDKVGCSNWVCDTLAQYRVTYKILDQLRRNWEHPNSGVSPAEIITLRNILIEIASECEILCK